MLTPDASSFTRRALPCSPLSPNSQVCWRPIYMSVRTETPSAWHRHETGQRAHWGLRGSTEPQTGQAPFTWLPQSDAQGVGEGGAREGAGSSWDMKSTPAAWSSVVTRILACPCLTSPYFSHSSLHPHPETCLFLHPHLHLALGRL